MARRLSPMCFPAARRSELASKHDRAPAIHGIALLLHAVSPLEVHATSVSSDGGARCPSSSAWDPKCALARGVLAWLLLLAGLPGTAWSGEEPHDTGSIRNPASVGEEIDAIDTPRQPRVPMAGLDSVVQPWYDLKSKLATNYGVRFGLAWTPLYQVATDSLDDRNQAAGGIFELLGHWTLVDRKGNHPGTIGLRVENRHRLGTGIAPQSLGAAIGTDTPTALGYGEFDLALAELYYEQEIVKERFAVRVGKTLPFGIYDFFLFKNPRRDFLNANFALNPSIAWPQFGLGAATEVRPREDLYLLAGVHDANGNPTRAGFDTFVEDREFFVVGEVGWDPGYLADETKNPMAPDVHATFWHTDARSEAGRPEGWGASFTAQKPFGSVVPFARYGYSDGGAALLEHLVMAGVTWVEAFGYQQDALGLAISYGKPSTDGVRDQYTSELYYRMQLTRRLAVTPSLQLIVNPSANPDQDLLAVFGLRARLDF